MKKTGIYRVWQVIYPIGIYYVVSAIAYFFLEMLLGGNRETYMLRQMVCAAVTIPFVLSFYKQDQVLLDTVYGETGASSGMQIIRNIGVAVCSGGMSGIAVNNLIAMTPLIEVSAGFQEANHSFFAGGVLYELLGSCLVIPIAEELLYRGVVLRRLRMMFGVVPAVVLSALIFGVMHANLVQFLYAGILGLLLGLLFQTTNKLYAPILGHIAANVAAVVRQETGVLSFAYEPTAAGIGFSLLLLAATAGLLYRQIRKV